ncbi:MAG: hypothetical protein KAT31_06005 [Bacteroidales bacterium]|nr:hypothetical protein [Bacteroidales bacterium]
MKTIFYILLLMVGFQVRPVAQVFDKPCFSLSSHPTLEIMSIEKWEDQTVVNIRVKNQRISGSFCFDKETFIVNSLGSEEWKLTSMDGIPACPDQHRFKSIGEVLDFSLVFPEIPDEVKYIDLREGCEDACVSVKYILLDEEMNDRINEGFILYEIGRLSASLQVFEDIMEAGFDNYSPVFGTLYLYMMSIHYELGQSKEVKRIFNELKESSVIGKDEFIETARDTGLVR